MIFIEALIYSAAGASAVMLLFGLTRYIRYRVSLSAGQPEPEQPPAFDLAHPMVRAKLRQMLDRYNISGSADIRDGQVLVPVPFYKMHPLLKVIDDANARLHGLKNPAACSLYIRDSVNDRFMLVPHLDLEDLRQIAELLRAALAERQRRGKDGD